MKAMLDFAAADPKVRTRLGAERIAQTADDFKDVSADEEGKPSPVSEPDNEEWYGEMEVDGRGNYLSTINNIYLILKNDPRIKGCMALDLFEHREIALKNLPWRKITHDTRYLTDKDDAGVRFFIEKVYKISNVQKVRDAMDMLLLENSFHPVKDYLNSVTWDGRPRIDTLLIDYLGAEDTPYTRAVTRKLLAAAVARIFRPGCKFDYMPILIGPQGKKKSMLIDKLGRQWFSDSFTTVQGKESFEQLQGVWMVEVAELAALKRAEVEAVKHFVSKRKDRYRVAFGRRVEDFPRQSVFFATSNQSRPLRDPTGGRRFWPVPTHKTEPLLDVAEDLTDEDINQVWAEAVVLYNRREKLYLPEDLELVANTVQEDHSERDERTGVVQEYLDRLLPDNWEGLDVYQRREWLRGDELQAPGTVIREKVCIAEIWCEALGRQHHDMTTTNTKDLHDIMRKVDGWKEYDGKIRFGVYGIQRAYVNKNIDEEGKNSKRQVLPRVATG